MMSNSNDKILLDHGGGGQMMHELIGEVFIPHFKNAFLEKRADSAVLPGKLAFTTDSFTITPYFFPGGDIGKLAIAGTVNDLAVSGARPLYLSAAFVIEEGFAIDDLRKIATSMARQAKISNVQIVTGDTKVVGKGDVDGIYISMSGLGEIIKDVGEHKIETGDVVLTTGGIGEHGFAVMAQREGINLQTRIVSDCASLNEMIVDLITNVDGVKFMRDPTRGGIAATLNEVVRGKNFSVQIHEERIPVKPSVRAVSELLGIDVLQSACEGRALIIVAKGSEKAALSRIRKFEGCEDACEIGEVAGSDPQKVVLNVAGGGKRVVSMPRGEGLPRIC